MCTWVCSAAIPSNYEKTLRQARAWVLAKGEGENRDDVFVFSESPEAFVLSYHHLHPPTPPPPPAPSMARPQDTLAPRFLFIPMRNGERDCILIYFWQALLLSHAETAASFLFEHQLSSLNYEFLLDEFLLPDHPSKVKPPRIQGNF